MRAQSATLPLAYMVVAATAFLLAAGAVPWLRGELAGHYYHPRLLALTHTVSLGWVTLTIMGATYQLVPVVLERPLWSERLARWQLVSLAAGIVGMVAHFWIGQWPGLVWAAAAVGLGVLAHLVNLGLSLRGLARWTFSARCVLLALGGLGLTAAFGLTLGLNRMWRLLPGDLLGTLHAHFHLALLGWITPMVIGVAARVYPMFLLAPEPGGWPGQLQLWGLGLGVPLTVASLLAGWTLVVPGAALVAAALAAHAAWVIGMARRRRRPTLDWGLRFVFTGTAFLAPATVIGLGLALGLLSGPRPALAYAALALGGWVSLTIVGMMLKIVPFLVWFRVYGPRVGREPVPTLAQLAWPPVEGAAWACLTGGVLGLAAATAQGARPWIGVAGAGLALGAALFAAALARMLLHLVPRRTSPVPAAPLGGRP